MKASLLKKLALATSIGLASYFCHIPSTRSVQEVQYNNYENLEDKLGAYYTTEEYEKRMGGIVKENPKIASMKKIGESWHKRPIYALKISDENENIEGTTKKEPQIIIIAQQHAKELIGGVTAIATAEYLTKNYSTDKKVKSYVDNNEIYIVPLANPDGLAIIEGSLKQITDAEKAKKILDQPLTELNEETKLKNTWWRKNARDNNEDGIILEVHDGVDLNRNYSTGWTNGESYADNYSGPHPFSEPETKAIKGLAESLDNLAITVDLHSYLGMIMYPPGYEQGGTKQEELFKKIAKEMVKRQPYKKYEIKRLNSLYGSTVGGSFTDWAYFEHNALSLVIEVYKTEPQPFPDIVNFNPPQQEISKVIENVIPMILYLFEISDSLKNP
ncbi:MAG: M14 family zinc carboxypeptidase [Nanoarchaeota archaeon]|nr:M14 family zinc carboxypeptidase [Nanoarchaeota archaeon]